MGKRSLERRLTKIGIRLKVLRGELAIVEEQLLYLGEDADDQAIRTRDIRGQFEVAQQSTADDNRVAAFAEIDRECAGDCQCFARYS